MKTVKWLLVPIGFVCVLGAISCSDGGSDGSYPPRIVSAPDTSVSSGTAYSYTITASGSPSPSITVTGLPGWLTFDETDTISGTAPASPGTTGTITVTANNGVSPDAVQTFTIDVTPPYKVIDLTTYEVTGLPSAPADLLTNDEYKTTKLVLKRIPAGTFQMGDQVGGHSSSELPVHTVNITQDFYIGVFEVTQRQWYEVQGDWPSYFTTNPDKRPVEQVSHDDVQGFLSTLSSATGETIDLPTEAQWEYACKAGTSTNYSYGDTADGAYMWYYNNSGSETHEVGTREPNPWGLYDMHGNVWEWCRDWYDSSYYSSSPTDDPEGPATGSDRVFRGGGWCNYLHYCRSADRRRDSPTYRYYHLGFRVLAVRWDE